MATSTPERLLPLASSARRKSDGTAYTDEDREALTVIGADGVTQTVQRVPYFELVTNGGVRRYEFVPYPAMVYRGAADALGKVELKQAIAESEAHLRELEAEGWCARQEDALERYEQGPRAIAQAAADVAAKVQGMSAEAQRDYKQRSAKSPTHITE